MLIDVSIQEAKKVSEKLRLALKNNLEMKKATSKSVTASFGLTICKESDTLDSAITRADNAMYQAKTNGKNQVVCIV